MTVAIRKLPIRAQVNNAADFIAIGAAIVVFGTGLVLLTHFHVGGGSLRGSGLGLSRLVWVNLHRLSALALVAAVAVHAQIHWRAIAAQFGRAFGRRQGKASRADLVLYLGFAVASMAGLIAWFAAPGSPPLFGPVTLSHAAGQRHAWLDVHHVSGLIVLPAAVIHIRRHFQWIVRTIGWQGKRA
jgi:hypothetical protein